MGHSIYTGSFGALEVRWMDVLAESQREDPLLEVNVLVGSNILATYLKRRCAGTGRALANVRFLTFVDLADRLSGVLENIEKKRRLPALGNSIILEDILATQTPSVYQPLAGLPGFRQALLDTFRDLRDAGITPRELSNIIDADPGMKDRRQQLAGLTDLFSRFREKVRLFHDVDDDFRAAIRNAPEAGCILGSRQLLVYGIYDATGQQSQLLASLKNVFDMVYFIPYVSNSISEFAQPFLEARARELGVNRVQLQEKIPVNSLDHLAARGFGLDYLPELNTGESLQPDGSFALVSAPGESRSAVEIVREVFQAVREGVIGAFHEAAVILRQPESDAPVMSEAFRLRGVPCFIHGGSSFADRPLSRAVVALSKLTNSFSREAVLTAMELVAAALPEESASAWDVQSWRSLTNDPRFLGDMELWNACTEALVDEARKNLQRTEAPDFEISEDEEEGWGAQSVQAAAKRLDMAESLRNGWRHLQKALAAWPAGLSWADWASFLDRQLQPLLGASEDWPSFSAVLDELGNLQMLGESGIRDSRFEMKNPKATVEDEHLISADRMRTALIQSLSSLSYPEGRFQRSGVNLLSTSAARGLRFPLVIIPCLDEGRFPAKLRQDPLLLDSERRLMDEVPIKSRRVEEEKLLFDMAARSAEKRLVLMTSRLDESSDRERIPSQFFLRSAAAIRGRAVSIRDLAEGTIGGFRSVSLDNPAPAKNAPAVDEGEIRLRLITADRDSAHQALKALEQMEPSRLARPLAYDQSRWIPRLTAYDGYLAEKKLVLWMAGRLGSFAGQVSASRLEEYAKCPYYFFLKRGMELEAWEEPAPIEAMDPLDRGVVVHSILEIFLRDHRGKKLLSTHEESIRQALSHLASETLDRSKPAGIPDLLWEIERESILGMLDNWLEFERERAGEGMLPARLEQTFGEFTSKDRAPAFRLNAGRHSFEFRGRIDRVDISGDGTRARVIDYKTGSVPETMTRKTRTPLMSGERIQIVIYRGALSGLDEFKGVKTVEGEYLHLQPKDGQTVPCSFTDAELQAAAKALPGILEIVGDGIESGAFFIRTKGTLRPNGHCDYCDYLTICGKDRERREERKAGDSAVRRFLQILEPLG
jgi:RecB family exonuclease